MRTCLCCVSVCEAQLVHGRIQCSPLDRGLSRWAGARSERNDGLYRPITYLVFKMMEELIIVLCNSLVLSAVVFYPLKLSGDFTLFWLVFLTTSSIGIGAHRCLIVCVGGSLKLAQPWASELTIFLRSRSAGVCDRSCVADHGHRQCCPACIRHLPALLRWAAAPHPGPARVLEVVRDCPLLCETGVATLPPQHVIRCVTCTVTFMTGVLAPPDPVWCLTKQAVQSGMATWTSCGMHGAPRCATSLRARPRSSWTSRRCVLARRGCLCAATLVTVCATVKRDTEVEVAGTLQALQFYGLASENKWAQLGYESTFFALFFFLAWCAGCCCVSTRHFFGLVWTGWNHVSKCSS